MDSPGCLSGTVLMSSDIISTGREISNQMSLVALLWNFPLILYPSHLSLSFSGDGSLKRQVSVTWTTTPPEKEFPYWYRSLSIPHWPWYCSWTQSLHFLQSHIIFPDDGTLWVTSCLPSESFTLFRVVLYTLPISPGSDPLPCTCPIIITEEDSLRMFSSSVVVALLLLLRYWFSRFHSFIHSITVVGPVFLLSHSREA